MSESSNQSSMPAIEDSVDLEWNVLDTSSKNNNMPAKTTWPELVGMTAEEAEKKIKEEFEGAYTPVVNVNGFTTYDYRTNRVWLFVDDAGKVVRTPSIG